MGIFGRVRRALAPGKASFCAPTADDNDCAVRIFISSTFLDMQVERDELVRKTFPALRMRFRARGVELTEIDLRWGVTQEELEARGALPICLAEIDRCRPYFIGLLGERYGSLLTSDKVSAELEQSFPVLREAVGRSLTEIEILHAVFRDPRSAARAFFFERDPAWLDTLSPDERSHYGTESEQARKKLADLKSRIRASGSSVIPYLLPSEIGPAVEKILGAALEERFPEQRDDHAAVRLHATYARERSAIYVGGDRYFAELDSWVSRSDDRRMGVTGPAAIGKSALIANWLAHRRKVAADDIIFEHYVGASPDGADPIVLYRRLWAHLNVATRVELKIPGSDELLARDALTWRLAQAAKVAERRGCKIIIAIDDLDRIQRVDIPRQHYDPFDHHDHLTWLRRLDLLKKPGRVKFLASYTHSDYQQLPVRLDGELTVKALAEVDRRLLIERALERWGRKLSKVRISRILTHPLADQPLFLGSMLGELRFSATEAVLDARLAHYASTADWHDFFTRILERIENDFGVDLVRTIMGLIWVSKVGLTETDIVACSDITPLAWAKVRNNFDEMLRIPGGTIQFSNDQLRQAVEARYLTSIETQHAFRRKLADYMEQLPPSAQRREELPFQLRATQQWDRLAKAELPAGIGDEKMSYIYAIEERDKPRITHGPFHIYQQMAGGGDMLAICQHCYHVEHFVPREGESPGDCCPNCGADGPSAIPPA